MSDNFYYVVFWRDGLTSAQQTKYPPAIGYIKYSSIYIAKERSK
jgi:hypothetical protein